MKIAPRLVLLLTLSALPSALFADSSMDRKIEDAAKGSYNFRTVLENNVKVDARDGVVTLSGAVLDRDQKALAEETVKNLPGVTAVENKLEISAPGPERADGWIALKIRSLLLVRANVSVKNTDVTVRDGVVTLAGTVESVAQKELTAAYAREVEGVKSVVNRLQVVAPAHVGEAAVAKSEPTLRAKIDDGSITAQVKYALLTHHSTSALKTSVLTRGGMVILEGEAHSPAERDLVSQLARSVRGVSSVINRMTVSTAAE